MSLRTKVIMGLVVPLSSMVGLVFYERFMKQISKFGSDGFGGRVAMKTGNELEQIGDDFDEMAMRLEKRIKAAEDRATQFRRESKLKDEFISITAHELRAPLTAIRGYTQLSLRHLKTAPVREDVVDSLNSVIRQVDSMVTMINRLLDISRIQMGRLVLEKMPFDIVALVKEVKDRMQITTGEHRLRLIVPEEPIVVNGDAARIEQVLNNLISNAIKYSPGGGDIYLKVAKQALTVLVTVEDRGIGIPKDKQDNIFQMFYRAEADAAKGLAGTGLGLYISRGIVEAHRGRICFKSIEGNGSIFSFTIPL